MKIVAVIASPDKKGNTEKALDFALSKAKKQNKNIKIYNAFEVCFNSMLNFKGSDIKDLMNFPNMDDFFEDIKTADVLIFASPIYFNGFPAPMKFMIDRFQLLYEAFRINDLTYMNKKKRGYLIWTAGQRSYDDGFIREQTERAFKYAGAKLCISAGIVGTDNKELKDYTVLEEIAEALKND